MDTSDQDSVPLIRLAHPLAFAGVMDAAGGQSANWLKRAGLPVYSEEASMWVPLSAAWKFFSYCDKAWDPGMGWHVGDATGDQKLTEKIREITERSPSLYTGLQRLIRLIRLEASHLELGIIEGNERALLCSQYPFKDWPGYHASQAYQLAVYINLIRHYCGKHWMPEEIGIEQRDIPKRMQELFPQTTLRCGQTMGYIAISRKDLHKPPLQSAIPVSEKMLSLNNAHISFTDAVYFLAESYIGEGYLSAHEMAKILEIPERSFYRKMADHGIRYQSLLDDARFNKARQLIQMTDMPTAQIALETGFTDTSNFNRMFRRIAGITVGQYRRSLQEDSRK